MSSPKHDVLSQLVRIFLNSNLSVILIIFSLLVGAAALLVTPREEDPQIVVPLADVFVHFPGHSASEVEQLVATPLERMLYQIDGVEYVYSMSREDEAVITVRFYVGQDRERSLVKLFKKLNENSDLTPSGVTNWVMKPVEIDDVPIVTLTLASHDPPEVSGEPIRGSHALRRVAEELVERLAIVPNVSRAYVVGGEPRAISVDLDSERLRAYELSAAEVTRSIGGANVTLPVGGFTRSDRVVHVEAGVGFQSAEDLTDLVVGVFGGRPVYLKDVATIRDGPTEVTNYVRHSWGPARGFAIHAGAPGTEIGTEQHQGHADKSPGPSPAKLDGNNSSAAVTIAIAKQKGANAVTVAKSVLAAAATLREEILPADVQIVVSRNYGLTADEKVNELVEALAVAIAIVILLLSIGLGWREALIVAVAVPVVFGLTLAVNLLAGYTINRVTLFALILALGLLVDDPIVDVENIARHFAARGKATREIVIDAVAEIRPPLISATLAVIVSFLPMFFITGMMGPYMSPMALNVPIAMLMSMVVAFTITPWLTFHVLKHHYSGSTSPDELASDQSRDAIGTAGAHEFYDPQLVQQSLLYRFFRPLMVPLLKTRLRAWVFLSSMLLLTVAAGGLAASRSVPLKMLPFDNKNELLLVIDMDEDTTLERTNAVVRDFELVIAKVPEVIDFTSYVGAPSPIDFNGLVRHYYLREGPHLAELRVNLVGKKHRRQQSHEIGLRLRDELTALADRHGAKLRLVELPPGPPVLASLVAEVLGRPDHTYDDLLSAGKTVADRMRREPGVVEVDDIREAKTTKLTFVIDQEKAALAGVTVAEIAETMRIALQGENGQTLRLSGERNPLHVVVRLPRSMRSSSYDLAQLAAKGSRGQLIPLAELGTWRTSEFAQTIYHKNLERVVYVFAECAGRPPAECVVDLQADRVSAREAATPDADPSRPRPVKSRTFMRNGGGVAWAVPDGIRVQFAGEGEWKITLEVFRDLGLAFGAALVMIYIILVAQIGSFVIPVIVMLAIPLTLLGVMPGFLLLNTMLSVPVGGYDTPVFFTATAMIGMIALAGIVTRDSIILVDFMELAVQHGRPLFDAILESRVVRLRPILLTASAAMLSAIPITFDPIFSGLGWSLIFGLVASTLFTLFVIPATYWLLKPPS